MPPYYYTTKSTDKTKILGFLPVSNKDPLIELVPTSGGLVIDVVRDFCWTVTPKTNDKFKKVPVMYLTELEQTQNSLIGSALYYLRSTSREEAAENSTDAVNTLKSKLETLAQAAYESKQGLPINIDAVLKDLETSSGYLLGDRLKSYLGIYTTKPTGFQYVLPYFDNTSLGINNQWSSTAGMYAGSTIANVVETSQKVIEEAAATFNIMNPGTFIEKPKYYQYNSEGNSITVTFPLLNTVPSTGKISYLQNYELLWILIFQNRPYRTSFTRVSPPKLYTLTVPGQEFMPFCYISNMKIDFQGTRRTLPVTLGISPDATALVSIPDAYIVTITFQSLLANTGNTMVDTGFTNSKIRARSQ